MLTFSFFKVSSFGINKPFDKICTIEYTVLYNVNLSTEVIKQGQNRKKFRFEMDRKSTSAGVELRFHS